MRPIQAVSPHRTTDLARRNLANLGCPKQLAGRVGWAIVAEMMAHGVPAAYYGGRLGVCSRNVQPGDRIEGSDRMTQRSERGRLVPWVALLAALSGTALMIDASPREA